MASSVDAIEFKVNKALYSGSGFTVDSFREIQNRLVDEGVLNDEQLDQHNDSIHRLYRVWKAGLPTHRSERDQRLPTGPQTPKLLSPLAGPSKAFTSSSQENSQTTMAVEGLKKAVSSIIPDRELLDALTGWLYLPNDMYRVAVPVSKMKSSCSQSYIRAKTLKQNEIKWKGNQVILRWKNMAIHGDEDQRVQQTCFNVVDETVASQAGFLWDMLVGVDQGLLPGEKIRAVVAEETNSADSSVINQTLDLLAYSLDDFHSDVEPRAPPTTYCSPQPAATPLSFSGSAHEMAIFFKESRGGGDEALGALEGLIGLLIESQNHGSGKRKWRFRNN